MASQYRNARININGDSIAEPNVQNYSHNLNSRARFSGNNEKVLPSLWNNRCNASSLRLPADPSWPKIPHRRQSEDGGDIIDHPCIVTLTGTPRRSRTIVRSPRLCQGGSAKESMKKLPSRCLNKPPPLPEQPMKRRPSCMDPRFRKVTSVKSKMISTEMKVTETIKTAQQPEPPVSDKQDTLQTSGSSACIDVNNPQVAQPERKEPIPSVEEIKGTNLQPEVNQSCQSPTVNTESTGIHESINKTVIPEENELFQDSQKNKPIENINVTKSASSEKIKQDKLAHEHEVLNRGSTTIIDKKHNVTSQSQMPTNIPPIQNSFYESEIYVTSDSEIETKRKIMMHHPEANNMDHYPDADSEKDTFRDNCQKSKLLPQKRRTLQGRKNPYSKQSSAICPRTKFIPQYSTVESTDSEICPRNCQRSTYTKKYQTANSEYDRSEMFRTNVEELAYSTSDWGKDEFQKFLQKLDSKTRNCILSMHKRKIKSEHNIHAQNCLVSPSSDAQLAKHTYPQRHRRKQHRVIDAGDNNCYRNIEKYVPKLETDLNDTQTTRDDFSEVFDDLTTRTPGDTDSARTNGTAAEKPTVILPKTRELLNKSYWELYNKMKVNENIDANLQPMTMNSLEQRSDQSCDVFNRTPVNETLEHCSVLSSMINKSLESSIKQSTETIPPDNHSNADRQTSLVPLSSCPWGFSEKLPNLDESCPYSPRPSQTDLQCPNQTNNRILTLKTVGLFGCTMYIIAVFLPMIYDILFYDGSEYDNMSYLEAIGSYVYWSFYEAFGEVFDIFFKLIFRPIYLAFSIPVALVSAVLNFVTSIFFISW